MTSESLAKLYAEVVKVRPEAAVQWLFVGQMHDWMLCGDGLTYRADPVAINVGVAEAIILARWLSMVPPLGSLYRGDDKDGRTRWYVDCTGARTEIRCCYPCCDTPIEALAAYLKSTGEASK